jgi:hypothetical protein
VKSALKFLSRQALFILLLSVSFYFCRSSFKTDDANIRHNIEKLDHTDLTQILIGEDTPDLSLFDTNSSLSSTQNWKPFQKLLSHLNNSVQLSVYRLIQYQDKQENSKITLNRIDLLFPFHTFL